MTKDLISFLALSPDELRELFLLTEQMKRGPPNTIGARRGKTAPRILAKQSLRTHGSFHVGVAQRGGQAVSLSHQHIGLSSRESVRDVAEVLSCYNDIIIARTMAHETV